MQAVDQPSRRIECCPFCRTPQWAPESTAGEQLRCVRCDERLDTCDDLERNIRLSSWYTLLGVLLLVPAFSWPMLVMEQFLERKETGLVRAVVELVRYHEYFLAAVIGIASIVFPVVKLGFLLVLTSRWAIRRRHNRWTYGVLRFMNSAVEKTGRWGMLEVFLVGVMVFAFRMSDVFHVDWRFGTVVFTLMVLCTMAAGEYFRPEIYGDVYDERRE